MTTKVDGTNGILQSYDYQTPATGFSYTFAAGTQMLFMVPSGTLASGTITMPSAPADGMVITFSSSQQITALTLQGNTGQSVSNAVTFLPAKTAASYVYRLANTTWYPCQTVPGTGSQLVNATTQNTTSGTAIDFTGIPSWVKRITVMFNGVSLSGIANYRIQLNGETTGYVSASTSMTTGVATITDTSGFPLYIASAAAVLNGSVTITTLGNNVWTASGVMGSSTNTASATCGGAKTTSAAITSLRVTTSNGTDTFDAGSINLLFE